ncbi:MAG TPA: hypothetical protein VMT70_03675 [Vicinamibacteria bacterium]|nr:hypothetical protein [Vicinamibacteria bacterium]
MPFAYYNRLSARDRAIYRRSDAVTTLELPEAEGLRPDIEALRRALEGEDRRTIGAAARAVTLGLARRLGVSAPEVEVLPVRPSAAWGELHGLYTRGERRPARIQLWMRTVRHRRVVAFRTFLRTLLHEVGHHLDYELLRLPDSLHTEGFFKRESSLFRQLVPAPGDPRGQGSEPRPDLK